MNMGVEVPVIHEGSPGLYRVIAFLSMSGPWAVKIFLPERGEKIFSFEVGATH